MSNEPVIATVGGIISPFVAIMIMQPMIQGIPTPK